MYIFYSCLSYRPHFTRTTKKWKSEIEYTIKKKGIVTVKSLCVQKKPIVSSKCRSFYNHIKILLYILGYFNKLSKG